MMEAKYTFGTEPFTEWLSKNPDVEKLVLSGTMSQEDVEPFEDALFNSGIKGLQLQDFSIFYINDNNKSSYKEFVLNHVIDWFSKISPFKKILINADRTQSFIFKDEWIFSEDKKAVIHVSDSVLDYVHPEGVEYIGHCAFSGYEQLQSVTFNDSLIEIGEYAFTGCENLQIVILPDSVTTLGEGAFLAVSLIKLKLSANLTAIPDECFLYNDLDELIIPPSVKEIGFEVFRGAFLKKIDIPEGMEVINSDAFENLKFITLPASLKEIASDFYYEDCCALGDDPPYVDVHPNNPIYYAEKGTLYYKADGKQVLDAPYRGIEKDEMDNK